MARTILAGACKTDITPTDLRNVYLAGFAPDRKADRVIDPIHARALYLSDGENEFAIATYDLIGLMAPEVEKLRRSAGEIDPDRVWIASTHVHSGPDTMGLWGPAPAGGIPVVSGVDKKYIAFLVTETGRLLRRAKRLARPAKIAFAVDRSDKSESTWNVRNREIMDHDLSCMRITRADDGRAIATATNFGSHPEALWEKNTGVSADYLAHFHRVVEDELGGVSIFFNGALGAMVTPGIAAETPFDARVIFCREYGEELARIAVAAALRAKPAEVDGFVLQEKTISMPLKNILMTFINNLGVLGRPYDYQGVRTSVGILHIGPARFIAAPGEVQPEFGLELKSIVRGDPCFLISLCNDELGYLLPPRYFDDEAYHYETTVSPGRQTAEILKAAYRDLLRQFPR